MKWIARIASFILVVAGTVVLLGWIFDISILKSIHPAWVSMKANTALCFLLLGIALGCLQIKKGKGFLFCSQACSLIVFVISFLTLCEYFLGWKLGIDEFLFRDLNANGTSDPGRMAPATALNFLTISPVLFFVNRSQRVFVLIVPATVTSLMSFIGYLYGIKTFYGIAQYTQMAFHTALAFIVLILGILASNPNHEYVKIFVSRTGGGFVLRRLMLPAMIAPIALGWLILLGVQYHFYDARLGLSFLVLLSVFILGIAVWFDALNRNKIEAEGVGLQTVRASLERVRLIIDTAHDAFVAISENGLIIDWNRQAEQTFGWTRSEAMGRSLAGLIIPEQFRERHRKGIKHFLETGEGPLLGKRIEISALHRKGYEFPVELTITPLRLGGVYIFNSFLHDISERKKAEAEREKLIGQLQEALEKIETLRGLLPVCAWCKKIRDDQGNWKQMEVYIQDRSRAEFSHGICPECVSRQKLP